MKKISYTILLEGLKLLVRIKRGLVFLMQHSKQLFVWLDYIVRNTIGFRLYTWQKRTEKYIFWYRRIQAGRVLEFFGQRYILQTILIIIGVSMAFPHSQLYSQDSLVIPGRNTRLYAFSGPGDQNFDLEVIVVDTSYSDIEESGRFWSDGAVVRPSAQPLSSVNVQPTNFTSIAVGGRALIKPTILPGVTSTINSGTTSDTATNIKMKQPFSYIVQPGDVIGSIAMKFGVSVETILWANDLTTRSLIRPGDVLTILPTTGVVHTVKSGDTLGLIARLYKAEIGDILDENDIPTGGTIQIGQRLVIPGGTRIAAPTVAAPRPVVSTRPSVTTPSTPTTPAPPSSANPSQSGYIWPTNVRTITQYYGWRHTGVDIAGPIGSPLYASKAGTVVTSQCGWNGGYGCYVIIDHGDGFQTLYAHASELYVSVGESVTQGQTIAAMGSTGRSTGPHIHFEIRIGGRHANPFSYVN